jgi:hypothetical protein
MKITKFYLNRASYIAKDDNGNKIVLDINYWGNTFRISSKNSDLEKYAQKLLKKKHKVNFVNKMIE